MQLSSPHRAGRCTACRDGTPCSSSLHYPSTPTVSSLGSSTSSSPAALPTTDKLARTWTGGISSTDLALQGLFPVLPCSLEGWLQKRAPGRLSRHWDHRWFALRGSVLIYYEERGRVHLDSPGVQVQPCDDPLVFHLVVPCINRTYELRSPTKAARARWVSEIETRLREQFEGLEHLLLAPLEQSEGSARAALEQQWALGLLRLSPPRRHAPTRQGGNLLHARWLRYRLASVLSFEHANRLRSRCYRRLQAWQDRRRLSALEGELAEARNAAAEVQEDLHAIKGELLARKRVPVETEWGCVTACVGEVSFTSETGQSETKDASVGTEASRDLAAKEVDLLHEEMARKQQLIALSETHAFKLNQALKDANERLADQTATTNALRAQVERATADRNRAAGDLAAVGKEVTALRELHNGLCQEVSQRLGKDAETLEEAVGALLRQYEKGQRRCEELVAVNKRVEEEVAKLRESGGERDGDTTRLSEEYEKVNRYLAAQLQEAHAERDRLEREIETAELKARELEEVRGELLAELEKRGAAVTALEEAQWVLREEMEAETTRAANLTLRIDGLERDLQSEADKSARQAVAEEEQRQKAATLLMQLEKAEAKVAEVEQEKGDLERCCLRLEGRLEALSGERATWERQLKELREREEAEWAAKEGYLQREVHALQGRLEGALRELDDEGKAREAQEEELNVTKERSLQLVGHLEALRASKASVTEQLQAAHKEKGELQKRLEEAVHDCQALREKLASERRLLEGAGAEKMQLVQQLEVSVQAREGLQRDLDKALATAEETESAHKHMSLELEALVRERDKLQRTADVLQESLEALRDEHTEKQRTCQELTDCMEHQHAELRSLQEQYLAERKELEGALSRKSTKIENLRRKVSELQTKAEEVTARSHELERMVEERDAVLQEAGMEKDVLLDELQKVNSRCAALERRSEKVLCPLRARLVGMNTSLSRIEHLAAALPDPPSGESEGQADRVIAIAQHMNEMHNTNTDLACKLEEQDAVVRRLSRAAAELEERRSAAQKQIEELQRDVEYGEQRWRGEAAKREEEQRLRQELQEQLDAAQGELAHVREQWAASEHKMEAQVWERAVIGLKGEEECRRLQVEVSRLEEEVGLAWYCFNGARQREHTATTDREVMLASVNVEVARQSEKLLACEWEKEELASGMERRMKEWVGERDSLVGQCEVLRREVAEALRATQMEREGRERAEEALQKVQREAESGKETAQEVEKLQGALRSTESTVAQLQAAVEHERVEREKVHATVQHLENERAQLCEQVERAEEAVSVERARTATRVEEVQRESEQATQVAIQRERTRVTQEVNALREEARKAEEALQQKEKELKTLAWHLEQLEGLNVQLENEVEKQCRRVMEVERQREGLAEEVRNLKQLSSMQEDELRSQMDEIKAMDRLVEEVQALHRLNDQLKEELHVSRLSASPSSKQHQRLVLELRQYGEIAESLSAELRETKGKCTMLEQELADRACRVEVAEAEIREWRGRCEETERQMGGMQEYTSVLQQRLDESQGRCAALEGEVAEAKERLGALEREVTAHQDRSAGLEADLHEARTQWEQCATVAQNQKGQIDQEMNTLKQRLDVATIRGVELENKLGKARQCCEALEHELTDERHRRAKLKEETDEMVARLRLLEASCASRDDEVAGLWSMSHRVVGCMAARLQQARLLLRWVALVRRPSLPVSETCPATLLKTVPSCSGVFTNPLPTPPVPFNSATTGASHPSPFPSLPPGTPDAAHPYSAAEPFSSLGKPPNPPGSSPSSTGLPWYLPGVAPPSSTFVASDSSLFQPASFATPPSPGLSDSARHPAPSSGSPAGSMRVDECPARPPLGGELLRIRPVGVQEWKVHEVSVAVDGEAEARLLTACGLSQDEAGGWKGVGRCYFQYRIPPGALATEVVAQHASHPAMSPTSASRFFATAMTHLPRTITIEVSTDGGDTFDILASAPVTTANASRVVIPLPRS